MLLGPGGRLEGPAGGLPRRPSFWTINLVNAPTDSTNDKADAAAISADVRRADGTYLPVYVRNLCPSGCWLFLDPRLEVGESITLVVPGLGRMRGHVRWTANKTTAVSFLL